MHNIAQNLGGRGVKMQKNKKSAQWRLVIVTSLLNDKKTIIHPYAAKQVNGSMTI